MPERGEGNREQIESGSLQAKSGIGSGSDGALEKADAKLAQEAWAETRARREHPRLLAEAVSLNGSKTGSLALNMTEDGTFAKAKEKPTVTGDKSPGESLGKERKSIEQEKTRRPEIVEERGSKSVLSDLNDAKEPAKPELKGTRIAARRYIAHQNRVQDLGKSNWGTASHGILDGNLNRGIGAALVLSVGLSYYIQYRQSHEAPPLYEKPCKLTGK